MLTKFVRSAAYAAFFVGLLVFAFLRDLLGLITGATYKEPLFPFVAIGSAYELFRWITGITRRENFALLQQLISKAEAGEIDAQISLARDYRLGMRPATKDLVQASKWYRRAAEQGDAEAQFCLGQILQTSKGRVRDESEAVVWFRKAADQEHRIAQIELGIAYLEGIGVPQKYDEAIKWFSLAANHRQARAQYYLAQIYSEGLGVPRDDVQALMWCDLALRCETVGPDYHDLGAPSKVPSIEEPLLRRMNRDEIDRAYQLARQWLEEHGK